MEAIAEAVSGKGVMVSVVVAVELTVAVAVEVGVPEEVVTLSELDESSVARLAKPEQTGLVNTYLRDEGNLLLTNLFLICIKNSVHIL